MACKKTTCLPKCPPPRGVLESDRSFRDVYVSIWSSYSPLWCSGISLVERLTLDPAGFDHTILSVDITVSSRGNVSDFLEEWRCMSKVKSEKASWFWWLRNCLRVLGLFLARKENLFSSGYPGHYFCSAHDSPYRYYFNQFVVCLITHFLTHWINLDSFT
jgi:hypothetical protein